MHVFELGFAVFVIFFCAVVPEHRHCEISALMSLSLVVSINAIQTVPAKGLL